MLSGSNVRPYYSHEREGWVRDRLQSNDIISLQFKKEKDISYSFKTNFTDETVNVNFKNDYFEEVWYKVLEYQGRASFATSSA